MAHCAALLRRGGRQLLTLSSPRQSSPVPNCYTRLDNLAWSHSVFIQFSLCRKRRFMKPLLWSSILLNLNYTGYTLWITDPPPTSSTTLLKRKKKKGLRTVDMWHVTDDQWHMTSALWYVKCDMWLMVGCEHYLKNLAPWLLGVGLGSGAGIIEAGNSGPQQRLHNSYFLHTLCRFWSGWIPSGS